MEIRAGINGGKFLKIYLRLLNRETKNMKDVPKETKPMEIIQLCRKVQPAQIKWSCTDYVTPWRTSPSIARVSKVSSFFVYN